MVNRLSEAGDIAPEQYNASINQIPLQTPSPVSEQMLLPCIRFMNDVLQTVIFHDFSPNITSEQPGPEAAFFPLQIFIQSADFGQQRVRSSSCCRSSASRVLLSSNINVTVCCKAVNRCCISFSCGCSAGVSSISLSLFVPFDCLLRPQFTVSPNQLAGVEFSPSIFPCAVTDKAFFHVPVQLGSRTTGQF
jgi:hypothetical protein